MCILWRLKVNTSPICSLDSRNPEKAKWLGYKWERRVSHGGDSLLLSGWCLLLLQTVSPFCFCLLVLCRVAMFRPPVRKAGGNSSPRGGMVLVEAHEAWVTFLSKNMPGQTGPNWGLNTFRGLYLDIAGQLRLFPKHLASCCSTVDKSWR